MIDYNVYEERAEKEMRFRGKTICEYQPINCLDTSWLGMAGRGMAGRGVARQGEASKLAGELSLFGLTSTRGPSHWDTCLAFCQAGAVRGKLSQYVQMWCF